MPRLRKADLYRATTNARIILANKNPPAKNRCGYQCSLESEGKNNATRASQFVFVIDLRRIIGADIRDIKGNYGLLFAHYAQLRPHRLPR
jgi:hypothetical protein